MRIGIKVRVRILLGQLKVVVMQVELSGFSEVSLIINIILSRRYYKRTGLPILLAIYL